MAKINVIDMYHGNAVKNPDFAGLRENGVFGIIHKASQGVHYRDPAYASRRKAVVAAGMLWGAYHFMDSSDARAQAAFFLDCAGATDGDPILLACDFEDHPSGPDHDATLQQAMIFMREVDAARPDVQCVLYSGNRIRETLRPHAGGHQDLDMKGADYFFQQHRLWLAQYGPLARVPYPWDHTIQKASNEGTPLPAPGVWLWQFTESGRVNPLIGKTDGNYFDGTFEELKSRWLA